MKNVVHLIAIVLVYVTSVYAAELPTEKEFANSIGMKFVRIELGSFVMGSNDGEFDEKPVHKVNISGAFYMGITEVTNAQYEMFDPSHRQVRGRSGLSHDDDEAVIYVNWYEAAEFCKWLSVKEGKPYRLPSEAEWEYACRAGTATKYFTGDSLPKEYHNNPVQTSKPIAVPLKVGQSRPNKWGLYDMHGNAEEWCLDWYGPYTQGMKNDPVGYIDGNFKVTRGGSHSTMLSYLRSANRSGALSEDRNWVTGFRVVSGAMPQTAPLPMPAKPDFLKSVKQEVPAEITKGPDKDKPYYRGPLKYVTIAEDSNGPLFSEHNHDPAITECTNGDLLAIWFSTVGEKDRQMTIAASRLRYGADRWDPAYLFWDAPDRNATAPSLWTDEKGKIYHFNGQAATCGWGTMAVIMRTSDDNGVTWSRPNIILADYGPAHQPVESTFRTSKGYIIMPNDDRGGTTLWFSGDNGKTWFNPGGKIAGIHAGVAELSDGSLLAFGRGGNIDGKMPASYSSDDGKTWQYKASEFQPIGGGQRLVLKKLNSGVLFFASFAKQLPITDSSGQIRNVNGLFGALSHDQGKTWRHKRLITDDKPARDIGTMDNHLITLSPYSAEPTGYLSVCETADGVIHLISSIHLYSFNQKWVETAPPSAAPSAKPEAVKLKVIKSEALDHIYEPTELPSKEDWGWNFNGANVTEEDTISFPQKGVMKIKTAAGQQVWWRSNQKDTIGKADYKKGFTAEIRTKILRRSVNQRGIDLEIYDGKGHRYIITITDSGVYWYRGNISGSAFLEFENQYEPLIENIDNTDGFHTYRLAIRPDRTAQIYRDKKLTGTRLFEYRTPLKPYIYFGAGQEAEALVDYVAFDTNGAYQPR